MIIMKKRATRKGKDSVKRSFAEEELFLPGSI